jgi:hypothetical protein
MLLFGAKHAMNFKMLQQVQHTHEWHCVTCFVCEDVMFINEAIIDANGIARASVPQDLR